MSTGEAQAADIEIDMLARELFNSYAQEYGTADHWLSLCSMSRFAWRNIATRLLASEVVFLSESDATAAAFNAGFENGVAASVGEEKEA